MTRSVADTALANLVDRGAAGRKVRHHLRRDSGRKGRNAVHGDPVIAGEHQHVDVLDPRRIAAPSGEPGDHLLQPAETAGRLGQLGLPRHHGRRRRTVAFGQLKAGLAQFSQRTKWRRLLAPLVCNVVFMEIFEIRSFVRFSIASGVGANNSITRYRDPTHD